MDKWVSVALSAALLLIPDFVLGHGLPPLAAHGGQVQEAHEFWVELLVTGAQLRLFVLDEGKTPVQGSQLSGTASVLTGGKIYKITLVPGSDNSLEGELPVSGLGASAATVLLKVRGQPVSARFAIANQTPLSGHKDR